MILILSIPSDQTTNEIIKWLIHYNMGFIRLNESQPLMVDKIRITSTGNPHFILKLQDGRKIDSNEITSYWYRRSDLNLSLNFKWNSLNNIELRESLRRHLAIELDFLKSGIHDLFKTIPSLNDYKTAELNKIEILLAAKGVGLAIPDTIISTDKKGVHTFHKHHKAIISKALQRGCRFKYKKSENDYEYLCYTEEFNSSEIPDSFFPSLFQEKLEKRIELRIFFLCGQCYSMAIFSQEDEKTATDFRKYNHIRPNRNTPFQLPKKIEDQLSELMKKLNLNSGSIDMVLTGKMEYVFLEVNSIGQFGMVSTPCNYELYQKVAQVLINPNKWMKN